MRAFRQGSLRLNGSLAPLAEPAAFDRYLQPVRQSDWVVYSKPPFDGPARGLDYLGRYTHCVAISNDRLLAIENDHVRFRWKDYRQPHRRKTMSLPAEEFIRRFLLHVLPRDFHRIRHCGFLASRHRTAKHALCRRLLDMPPVEPASDPPPDYRDRFEQLTGESLRQCPACRHGRMLCVETFQPGAQPPSPRTPRDCRCLQPITRPIRSAAASTHPGCAPPLAPSPVAGASSATAASRSSPNTLRATLRPPLRATRRVSEAFRPASRGQAIPIACQRLTPSDSLLSAAATIPLLWLPTAVCPAADPKILFVNRHTSAAHLLRSGVDINTIRAWLGHAKLDTTAVYAEIDFETKAGAIAKYSPTGSKPQEPWNVDKGTMAFLRTL